MTKRQIFRFSLQRGFTLVEMAIVLLIAGLLVAGVSQIVGSSQKNRGDQAVANEVRTVVSALERFTVDYQSALAAQVVVGTPKLMVNAGVSAGLNIIVGTSTQDAMTAFQTNYLPAAISLAPYTIGLQQSNITTVNGTTTGTRVSFRAFVIRKPDNALDDARLARIASLIGTQGGMICNEAATCTAGSATGSLGSWTVTNTNNSYAVPAAIAALGSIAALTNTVDSQVNVNTLSRLNPAGFGVNGAPVQSEGNTMHTDLYMGDGKTDSWETHNVGGYGYVLTDTNVGDSCGPSVTTAYTYTASSSPTKLKPLSQDYYMIVVGAGVNATGVSPPVLLQCLPISAGSSTFQWQPVSQSSSKKSWHLRDGPNTDSWNMNCDNGQGPGKGPRGGSDHNVFVCISKNAGPGKSITLPSKVIVTNYANGNVYGCSSSGGSQGNNCQTFEYQNTYPYDVPIAVEIYDSDSNDVWSLYLPDQTTGKLFAKYTGGGDPPTFVTVIPANAHYIIGAPLDDRIHGFSVYEYRAP